VSKLPDHKSTGRHLVFNSSTLTSSEAELPTFPQIELNDRSNDFLALSTAHQCSNVAAANRLISGLVSPVHARHWVSRQRYDC